MSPADWEKSVSLLRSECLAAVPAAKDSAGLEDIRVRYLGRKGLFTELLKHLKDFSLEEKKKLGALGNSVKTELTSVLDAKSAAFAETEISEKLSTVGIDLSLPLYPFPKGRLHPLTVVTYKMAETLSRLGFSWAEGPMVETEYYNFEALNIPADHPSRDMHDTLYVKGPDIRRLLMRTHTSPVQIRRMESSRPPLRIMAPGRVYRHEAVDATHSAVFHQLEGFYVDRKVSMADLKGTLQTFLRELFGSDAQIRFRPSYFPFVEPGAEVDVKCIFCPGGESWCPVCKRTGWIELLGAGIVHPNVMKAVNFDPDMWSGFAFGIGIERVTMLLYGINDIRAFYENDLRLWKQL